MRQAQKKKEKDKIAIALMLCFCVIALTSIFTIKANVEKIKKSSENIPVSDQASTKQPINNTDNNLLTDKISTQTSKNIKTIESKPQENVESEKSNNSNANSFVFPVKSSDTSITNPYSMDSLIYSITLDQYMTHSGVDIEAPQDSQVVAILNGTVTSIYEDDRFGTSIEITHGNDLVSIYSNLSTSDMVEIGDVVVTGQVISGIGSSGLFESLEPPHLHFEILKGGIYVDPSEYIPLP